MSSCSCNFINSRHSLSDLYSFRRPSKCHNPVGINEGFGTDTAGTSRAMLPGRLNKNWDKSESVQKRICCCLPKASRLISRWWRFTNGKGRLFMRTCMRGANQHLFFIVSQIFVLSFGSSISISAAETKWPLAFLKPACNFLFGASVYFLGDHVKVSFPKTFFDTVSSYKQ